MSKWVWKGRMGPTAILLANCEKFEIQTVYSAQRLQFINRNIQFEKLIKSIIRSFGES